MKQKETVYYESSTINYAQYDFRTNSLIITFHSGASYLYQNVDAETYSKFAEAESQGKALNEHIKNKSITAVKLT